MDDVSRNSGLLPSGFEDLLPPDADAEYNAIAKLMGTFRGFGYRRIKPPLAEFEETMLSDGPGAVLSDQTFRLMDPLTHKMLALRSDITAQIARIALSRLSEAPRPLRVMYANDVIRTRGSQARTQRQFTQAGCEMIGRDDVQSDIEICVMALKGLSDLGLRGITLDFALPQRVDEIFALTQTPRSEIDSLRHRLAGDVDDAFAALTKIGLHDIARLKQVVFGVGEAVDSLGLDVSLTLDPLETRGFEYHNGLAFTMFVDGVRGEIGRGGRYYIYDHLGPSESAAGFTLYMDTVCQGLGDLPVREVKCVSTDVSWADIQKFQDDGFIVERES